MTIHNLPTEKRFPVERELGLRIAELISEYNGQLSLVATVGILEVVKNDLLNKGGK
ncbi:hypothetical protein [Serratia entomophila]|uniref:hypothetical protein n=1 Tax=Serratia entomophila TaxID=42906 RepID=UPI00217B816E|nr:hypothetical protein [Serratia entomophila]CAI1636822.1 Uncharacterised protein [Serratia entomophila]